MPTVLNYTESQALAALRGVILSALPGIEVIRALANRVPEPAVPDFVLMTVVTRARLETNVDATQDVVLAGTIAGDALIYAASRGDLRAGTVLTGPGVMPGTVVTAVASDTAATVAPAQAASGTFYAGYKVALAPTQLDVQLDVHGPTSGDNAQIISTLLRDEYATQQFDDGGLDLQALYASDPRQMPFVNAESQWEERWVVTTSLQANLAVQVPQEFADQVVVDAISVDAVYLP